MVVYRLRLKDRRKNTLSCEELFGLPKSGKTTLLASLTKKGYRTVPVGAHTSIHMLFYFLLYSVKHPFSTGYLFWKMNTNRIREVALGLRERSLVLRMRNSYLAAALSKSEQLRSGDKPIIDEFLLQSLFMIIQIKSRREVLEKIMKYLPRSENILLVEAPKRLREQRLLRVKTPARALNQEYKARWIENSEYNYAIVRDILLTRYTRKKLA